MNNLSVQDFFLETKERMKLALITPEEGMDKRAIVSVDINRLGMALTGFMKWFFGRQLGNEANLQIDVYAARDLPVADTRDVPKPTAARVKAALRELLRR